MPAVSGIYDLTIILYAMSVCLYFIDFIKNNRKANRIAFWLLSIVWIFQLNIFILKMAKAGEFPILSPVDGFFFLAWLLVTASLVLNWFLRIDFLVFFANLAGFAIMGLTLFKPDEAVQAELLNRMMSNLLVVHITFAFIAYTAFTVSAILSTMYFLEYQMLKKKQWGKRLFRFGSLGMLENLSVNFILAGVPLLMTALILGLIRVFNSSLEVSLFDPKIIFSFVVLAAYLYYLYQRIAKNLHGLNLIYYNWIAFLLMIINVFLSEVYTNFHLW